MRPRLLKALGLAPAAVFGDQQWRRAYGVGKHPMRGRAQRPYGPRMSRTTKTLAAVR
jgi:hypothetical protein